jgi:hypothetical protein
MTCGANRCSRGHLTCRRHALLRAMVCKPAAAGALDWSGFGETACMGVWRVAEDAVEEP